MIFSSFDLLVPGSLNFTVATIDVILKLALKM